MTTVIQHYDVPHIPFPSTPSSPGKSGANQETKIDNRGNAHIAVNLDSQRPSSSRLQLFTLQFTEM